MASKSKTSVASTQQITEVEQDESTKPDFIYGGPFIKVPKYDPLLETNTPINTQLQGTFKKSFAYYSLKERLPIILTKVIDYLSRQGGQIKSAHSASDADIQDLIRYISKLKNDLVTNKQYDLLTVDTPEAKKWNQYISEAESPYYFTNVWVFSECYVYRRLREGCELTKGLQKFDPFDAQKEKSFTDSVELMCMVADRLTSMVEDSDKDRRKADFITLLKLSLWSNKCDLSLSMGEAVGLGGSILDPFQMILDFKDKVLVDDSAKIVDQVIAKAENMARTIEGNTTFKCKCSCHRLAIAAGMPQCIEEPKPETKVTFVEEIKKEGEGNVEEKPIPCPAKMTIPQAVMFDIVCDNAGYELFADLCLAHFLISHKIVQKVRFHVKNMPWFVSDVTRRDFTYVIESCSKASFKKELPPEPMPNQEPAAEGEPSKPAPPPPPRVLTSESLRALGGQWAQYVADGTFIVMSDDFWTSPHTYKNMKKYDPELYRKLQFAVAILFKGDLNYRKLLDERRVNPYTAFEPCLQGFMPAPVIALRTIKADLVCGLPKGKWDQLNAIDEKWMEKGDYGVIQFCGKAEPLKVSDKPCIDYCNSCKGVVCPAHQDL